MISLPTVTLCAVSSVRVDETLGALQKSMRGISFAKVLFLTSEKVTAPEKITVIPIEHLDYDGYSHFMLYRLKDYIDTDFVLTVQHDGYVLHPEKWDDSFLKYDYIGAPWQPNIHFTPQGKNIRVGNGGFSLRSKKLLDAPTALALPFTDKETGFYHEDGVLCVYHRMRLEEVGILFAPVSIAARFSRERWCKDSRLFPFGFHNNRRGIQLVMKFFKKFL